MDKEAMKISYSAFSSCYMYLRYQYVAYAGKILANRAHPCATPMGLNYAKQRFPRPLGTFRTVGFNIIILIATCPEAEV